MMCPEITIMISSLLPPPPSCSANGSGGLAAGLSTNAARRGTCGLERRLSVGRYSRHTIALAQPGSDLTRARQA